MSIPQVRTSQASPAPAAGPSKEDRSARVAVTIFPLLILASFAIAMVIPDQAASLATGTNVALGIIMFGMGLTLTLPDFALVARRPVPVVMGVIAQYVIMPGVAWILTKAFQLDPALAAGVILVGCAPGGTSSNVISYLGKGDVALSVTMTSISTLIAPIMTPLLTKWLAGQYMPVAGGDMALSIVKIVLVPVLGGLLVRMVAGRLVEKVLPALPWTSVLGICYVVLAVVGKSSDTIKAAGLLVVLVVACHNVFGYLLGWCAGRVAAKDDPRVARTTSIEVGMQNSGLAAGLAVQYFTAEAALPGAVFSIWHNLSGAVLATIYRRSDARIQARRAAAGAQGA